MKNIFYRRDGQIAPLMIAIIVILIMAIMVTVNIGKIGLTKTHTANAADAGALAGSTTHANTLNYLADINTQMIAEYLSTAVIFVIPAPIETETARYFAFWAFFIAQTAQFVLAWSNGDQGYEDAESLAKQFAFMNAGIDEAKPRLSGESYEAYLKRESNFGQWMKDKGYDSGQYSWTDKNGGQNSFSVDVDAPAFPGLVPTPALFISFYYKWIPVCTPCGKIPCCNCVSCIQAASVFDVRVAKANRILSFSQGGGISPPIGYTVPNGTTGSAIIVPPVCPCGGMTAWATVEYFTPIAFIGAIIEDNPQVSITTTRVEPNADLGLREMKYGSISSGANAEAKGGSVGPVPNPGYDSYLISGGY